MNTNEIANELLSGLLELEQNGDLVITHTSPPSLADKLCSRVIQKWAQEFLDCPPFEVVVEDGVKSATNYLEAVFEMVESDARSVVEKFVSHLLVNRPLGMVAELVAHQGPEDVALGAYYCMHLQKGEYYDSGYLEWRKGVYAKARAQ